jgi:CMP-N-acetylneuraminic acid synthetase
MIDVLKHAVSWFDSQKYVVDNVILLQPTSPLRTSDQIDAALTIFLQKNPDTLVSIMEVPHQFNPVSVLKEESDGKIVSFLNMPIITRRQDKPVVYARNGPAILITKAFLIKKGILYGDFTLGYLMDKVTSIDVDNYQDLMMADFFLNFLKKSN